VTRGRASVPPPCIARSLSHSFQQEIGNGFRKSGPGARNVLYAIKDSIAYVTVNRPKVLKRAEYADLSDLRKAFEDARDDAAIRGVILTGAGDKAFIAVPTLAS